MSPFASFNFKNHPCLTAQIKMYLSDYRILELFGRFTKVYTVYYSALKYIFIWAVDMLAIFLSSRKFRRYFIISQAERCFPKR